MAGDTGSLRGVGSHPGWSTLSLVEEPQGIRTHAEERISVLLYFDFSHFWALEICQKSLRIALDLLASP